MIRRCDYVSNKCGTTFCISTTPVYPWRTSTATFGPATFSPNGRITAVFDLETTEKTLRVLDIGRTAIDLALEMKRTSVPDILEMLRDGYDEVDALTDKERDALPDAFRLATVACSAWSYNNGFQDYALDAMQHAESL
jgi:Ser/Thr protein kinase RdoA (MazF antagonist)